MLSIERFLSGFFDYDCF